ncbi:MAG: gliding motility-associated ABC transporter ATP-binding subunit GldA [Paludibacteraceae bacterium]|jgi:ABC-2 type transport system ATP-binding protein|nr:gliding motility-associated ABC transporter ATP-binding subunit GldA [Paludibacteraceae bacterium]MBO5989031.1 gliding motility-associated ABC transporter ATP-binding subunit GldA [Paludibacteraceae bacterium]
MSITVQNLRKSYGSQLVLDNISFSIKSGEIVGFLGNNGAGKSTTMKIITGYISYDAGSVEVCGIDVEKNPIETHRRIGYLPEHNPIYPEMYVKEYLRFVAGLYKLGSESKSRVDEMIEKTGLTREYKKKIGMLSKGYRQRVGLAQALIPNPDVLILDEPTTGLDPNQIIDVRNLIREVGKEKTVMLSTHIMQEVSAICDRVIIINSGKIVADGKESSIVATDNNSGLALFVEFSEPQDMNALKLVEGVDEISQINSSSYMISSQKDIREGIFRFAVANNQVILTMKQQERNMEDAFRYWTNSTNK